MKNIRKTYLFKIIDEESEFCGEGFFVEATTKSEAIKIAKANFPNTRLHFDGVYTEHEAEWIGYDTY